MFTSISISVPTVPVNLKVRAVLNGSLYVTWDPPSKPNGNVTHYKVYWRRRSLNSEPVYKRNYCNERMYSCLSSSILMSKLGYWRMMSVFFCLSHIFNLEQAFWSIFKRLNRYIWYIRFLRPDRSNSATVWLAPLPEFRIKGEEVLQYCICL